MPSSYGVESLDYLERSIELTRGQDIQSLFYAAFELRCALERTPFDYLVMVSGGKREQVMKRPQTYKPRDVFGLAYEVDPEWEKRILYANLVLRSLDLVSQTENLDTELVKNAHDQCNQYLHAQKDPAPTVNDPKWVQDFKDFLTETADKLLSRWRANRGVVEKLSPSGEAVWEHYKSGKYSDEQIVKMLQLSE